MAHAVLAGRLPFARSWPLLRFCGTFKSSINPEALYPGSSVQNRFAVVSQTANVSGLQFSGYIPMKKLQITYSCSSGPGGQNVNKVATKVEVRFHLDTADWLSDEAKAVLKEKLASQLTKEGYLISRSDRTRSQFLNQADALQKLRHCIWSTLDASIKTYLERTQEDELKREEQRKNHLKAARERVRRKRIDSQHRQLKRNPPWSLE